MACAQISKDCGFKCGKCRTVILIDNNEQIILLDTDNRESLKQKLSEKSDGLWHLQTDSLPDWVTDSINQVNVIHPTNSVKKVRQYIKNLAVVVIYAITIFSQAGPKANFIVPVARQKLDHSILSETIPKYLLSIW